MQGAGDETLCCPGYQKQDFRFHSETNWPAGIRPVYTWDIVPTRGLSQGSEPTAAGVLGEEEQY